MRFTPISEADAAVAGLLKRGIYDFEVKDAHEKESKAGNDMIEMLVRIYETSGHYRNVFDWLVDTEATAYKVRHFAAATGMLPQYEKGELRADDVIGKTGRCHVVVKKQEGYPEKNSISDYLAAGPGPLIASVAAPEMDDEIPF
jgi:hypothetical protein